MNARRLEAVEVRPVGSTWADAVREWGACGFALVVAFITLTLVLLHLGGVIGQVDVHATLPAIASTTGHP